jgi:hypothetical protein
MDVGSDCDLCGGLQSREPAGLVGRWGVRLVAHVVRLDPSLAYVAMVVVGSTHAGLVVPWLVPA